MHLAWKQHLLSCSCLQLLHTLFQHTSTAQPSSLPAKNVTEPRSSILPYNVTEPRSSTIPYTGYPTMMPRKELFGMTAYYVTIFNVIFIAILLRILFYVRSHIELVKAKKAKGEFERLRLLELDQYLNKKNFKRYNKDEGPMTELVITERTTVRAKPYEINEAVKKTSHTQELSSSNIVPVRASAANSLGSLKGVKPTKGNQQKGDKKKKRRGRKG